MDDNDSLIDLQAFKTMISELDEQELVTCNHLILERIKVIRAVNKAQSMAAFVVGDAVYFHDKQGGRVDATVARLNKKTLSLVTDDGQRWNVAPELCRIDSSITGDFFEHENSQQPSNVSVLPNAARQSAGKGRWSGGVVKIPAYVSDDKQAYRPLGILWLDADGVIVATDICQPQSDLQQVALATLQQALHSPMTGKPQRPKHITINDRDLADFLESRVPGITIEYGDTPMLDQAVNSIHSMLPPGDASNTYLSTGLSAEHISSFFDAAAALYRSAPWERVPHDACLLSVTIETLGLRDAVLSVIGQMGESFGIILYDSIQHYCQYHIASDRMCRGLDCDTPPHAALNFDEGAEVSAEIRKEVAEHGWQVVNTSSYPVLFTPDTDNVLRPLAAEDIVLFEALSRALPVVLKSRGKLIQAWNGGNAFCKKTTVECNGAPIAVEIGAPYPFEQGYASKDPADSTMIQLAGLAHTADEPDLDVHGELCEKLQDLFFKSPEGRKLTGGPSIVTPLLDLAFAYQSATIATLQAGSLEEIIFEIIPHKVVVSPGQAGEIIEECRMFYRFLKRQYALPQADHCLAVFEGNAISRLEAALSDDSGFGPGKAAITSGMLPDFNAGSLPPGLSFAPSGMPSIGSGQATRGKPVDSREKKKKRKATKKARKKNR